MAFDPDKYLAQSSFDPDSYLGADTKNQKEYGTLRNVVAGAVKGASDIGATLLYPLDATGLTGMSPKQRREALRQFFAENANTDSLAFKGGELVADIAGTAGAGGVLAKGAKVVGAAPKVVTALESGGMLLGSPANTLGGKVSNALLRAGAGAAVGGTAAAMINPSTIGEGALIGALVPGGVKTAQLAGQGIRRATGGLASGTIGTMTGTGQESVRTAYRAGKEKNQKFLEHMRGKADMTEVLDDAKSAVSAMREARAAEYRAGMAGVSADKEVLKMDPVLDAVSKIKSIGSYKGQQINKNAAGVVDDIEQTVSKWAILPPAEFHTPEGFDALKRAIGDIRDATQFGTPGRKAADQAYNAVKRQIELQAKDYAKVMKSYSEASELISEIERSLVGRDKASADTAMRKLQSLMRNNVQTNYGNRLRLAQELADKGGKDILPAVAGQSMNALSPRGLARLEQVGLGVLGTVNPAAWAALPLTSPRVMGELAYGAGRLAGGTSGGVNALLANPMIANRLASPSAAGLITVTPSLMPAMANP